MNAPWRSITQLAQTTAAAFWTIPVTPAQPSRSSSVQADQGAVSRLGEGVERPAVRKYAARWVRDLIIGAVVIVALPVVVLALAPARWLGILPMSDELVADFARLRSLMVPRDPSVTPEAAGAALVRVLPFEVRAGYNRREGTLARTQVQRIVSPATTSFTALGRTQGLPDFNRLISAAAESPSRAELAWLEKMATLPVWSDVELVARAPRVDVLGARLHGDTLPFTSVWELPRTDGDAAYRVAVAGAARAAWFVSRGEWARAEAALRTLLSFGYTFVDNPSHPFDRADGRAIMNVARSGLLQLVRLRPQIGVATVEQLRTFTLAAGTKRLGTRKASTAAAYRALLLDPRLPLSFRAELLWDAPFTVCSSVRNVVFGPSSADRAFWSDIHARLAFTATERRVLDDMDVPAVFPDYLDGAISHPVKTLFYASAKVSSVLTGNPRIAGCTMLLMSDVR